MNRTKLAYIIAPMFPTLYLVAILYSPGPPYTVPNYLLLVLMFSLPTSYLSCLFLGYPFVEFLRERESLNLVSVVVGGSLLGAVVFYFVGGHGFSALLGSSMSGDAHVRALISGAALGIMVALPFSLIAGLPLIHAKED